MNERWTRIRRRLGATVGLTLVVMLVAAWHIDVAGSSACQQDGTYLVTFEAESWDASHPATVTWDSPNPVTVPGTATSATNTAHATWSDSDETDAKTVTVYLDGTCMPPVTTTQLTTSVTQPTITTSVTQPTTTTSVTQPTTTTSVTQPTTTTTVTQPRTTTSVTQPTTTTTVTQPRTTTTVTETVSPTSITSTTRRSSTTSPVFAPTTVRPGGTAFTGVEHVVPLGAVALMLMTGGSGLLWAGSRRKRDQDQDEE